MNGSFACCDPYSLRRQEPRIVISNYQRSISRCWVNEIGFIEHPLYRFKYNDTCSQLCSMAWLDQWWCTIRKKDEPNSYILRRFIFYMLSEVSAEPIRLALINILPQRAPVWRKCPNLTLCNADKFYFVPASRTISDQALKGSPLNAFLSFTEPKKI